MTRTAYKGLGFFADPLTAYTNDAIQAAVVAAEGAAVAAGGSMIAEAVRAATRVTSQQMLELARVFEQGIDPGRRQDALQQLGEMGQDSVLRSYRATKGRSVSGYRSGSGNKYQRYAGGRMERALADPAFFTATPDTLDFINIALLDKRAAQWARLNFGAGTEGRGSSTTEPIRFGTLVIAALSLQEDPRPAMILPTGYFTDASGNPVGGRATPGAFYPIGTGPHRGRSHSDREGNRVRTPMVSRRTVGFEGRQFLDAGVSRIAREFSDVYQNLYKDLYRQGDVAIRPYRLRTRAVPFR